MERPNYPVYRLKFWQEAAKEYGKLRSVTFAALMIALIVAISSLFLPIPGTENLRIYFSYLAQSLGAAIYGPLVGAGVGLISDLIGVAVHPSGPFFFGYTLSAILGNMFYGLFLYRRRITVLRLVLCRLTVNVLINVGLGCIWSTMLYGQGTYFYYVAKSIVKNLLLLPVEAVLMCLLFGALAPMLKQYGGVSVARKGKLLSWI